MSQEALEASIEHHKQNLKELNDAYTHLSGVHINPQSCALCKKYLIGEGSCSDCLIFQATNQTGCHGTPYDGLVEQLMQTISFLESTIRAETNEIQFLEGLVDKAPHVKIGQHWRPKGAKSNYVLSCLTNDAQMALINMNTGVRYNEPVKVFNICDISLKEWKQICGYPESWELIPDK